MLTYFQEPVYELALSGGTLYFYVTYIAYIYQSSVWMTYNSLCLALSSIWFHSTKSPASYWTDQIVLNSWVVGFVYEAYVRHWFAVCFVLLGILYAVLMFYAGQADRTYAYHPSRFWSVFFHMTVHISSALFAIIIITFFPPPK